MKYTNEDFIRLIDAVEEQGGDHLDPVCMPEEVKYEKGEPSFTHGCAQPTLFDVRYDTGATVLVPEPVLEFDPKRSDEWEDPYTGEKRKTTRARKAKDKETDLETVIFHIVEREAEPSQKQASMEYPCYVKVCGIADNVGMWPRFRHAIEDERSK